MCGGETKVKFTADKEFSFNASQFSQEELAAKAHNYELERCESNVICVDYAMAGVVLTPADQGLRRNISLKSL